MKKCFTLFFPAFFLAIVASYAQNAQQLYFNQFAVDYDYQAASFVVDTPPPSSPVARAFLMWSKNFTRDPSTRGLTLDEFDKTGNFLTQQINLQPGSPTEYLLPKKIIKAKLVKGYYLLGYIIRSSNQINGQTVHSTPLVVRMDENLNLVWAYRVHFASLNGTTAQALIEYNDIIEVSNSDLVLAGRFSDVPGQQNRVLMTRLNQAGAVLWTYQYFLNGCNAEALSLAEAADRNIALTGYIEECGSTFSGPRRLLYGAFTAAGIPIVIEKLSGGQALSGSKIVRHTNAPGSDEFFITGYIDLVNASGAVNKQVLLLDIKESGGVITVSHIGDAGPEAANDLVFRDLGGNNYYLYLTGYTGSYYTNVKTEVFFLWLRYAGGLYGLAEFSTFPGMNSSYVARRGLEIKSAGRDRFAILDNADAFLSPQQRTFTNVLIRDLNDGTGNCIKLHQPPVTRYQLGVTPVSYNYPRLIFTGYRDVLRPFERVIPRPECGNFYIDPYNAFSLAPLVEQLVEATTPAAKLLPDMRIYPNPARDQLYLDYGTTLNKGNIIARVFSTDMRLVKEVVLPGGNRNEVSLSGLGSGLYFLQVQYKGKVRMFQVKKE
ncbi:T9SS type A sorting domain-containing protein [Chitinophaga japonensis]|uniref:Putative secreted protein (Por secretion system target) n=1 Tax=Chitinophaga japonensis TaxID=104662 RepID=A0A562SYL5_CHIJA|nr:T9SS type A sorting domain-containing protein [Chitinophaga japonensis]TWI86419.1 putative secreted protein (Por secretion system target) [Chitinophaga japonensis]